MLDHQRRVKILGNVRDKRGIDTTFPVELKFYPIGQDKAGANLVSGFITSKSKPASKWWDRYEFCSQDEKIKVVASGWNDVLGIQFVTSRRLVFPD